MTINGTDISTLGLRLVTVQNHLSHPARKRILTEPAMASASIRLQARTFSVILFGEFATRSALASVVASLNAMLTGNVTSYIIISEHQIACSAVLSGGAKVETFGVAVNITLNFTEAIL